MFYLPARSGKTPVFLKSLLTAFFTISFLSSFAQLKWYQDNDNDGFGNPSVSQIAISKPVGYVLNNTDCNDNSNNPPIWKYLGTQGGSHTTIWTSKLRIASNNMPFIAYANNTNYKLNVMKYDGNGAWGWSQVGATDFTPSAAGSPDFALGKNDTPYVAFIDGANQNKGTVMKFNGTSWVTVGSAGFTPNALDYAYLAMDTSGLPYLAYNSGPDLEIMRYNGNSWVRVGTQAFTAQYSYAFAFIIDKNNVPYVSYRDVGYFNQTSVSRFNGTSWVLAGPAGISLGAATQHSFAVDAANNLYIALVEPNNNDRVTVKKFNGSSWTNLGATVSAGAANSPSLAFDKNNIAYLAYTTGSPAQPVVMKYDGISWSTVATMGFTIISGGGTSLALDTVGIPYVGFRDELASFRMTVMKMTPQQRPPVVPALSTSANVILPGASTTLSIPTTPLYDAVVWKWYKNGCGNTPVDTGKTITVTPTTDLTTYYARAEGSCVDPGPCDSIRIHQYKKKWYQDSDSDGWGNPAVSQISPTKPTGYVLNHLDCNDTSVNGIVWDTVGNIAVTSNITDNIAVSKSGVPYIAFIDVGNGYKPTVKKYDGSSWVTVGNAGFSTSQISYLSLALDNNDIPYVVFANSTYSNSATVMKYDGSSWVIVGNANISGGYAQYCRIAIDKDNTPYIAYQEHFNNDKITVKKFSGSSWINVGITAFSTGPAWYISLAIDRYGIPYVGYQDRQTSSQTAKLMKFDGTIWADYGTSSPSGSIAGGFFNSISADYTGIAYHLFTNISGSRNVIVKSSGINQQEIGPSGQPQATANCIKVDAAGTPYFVSTSNTGNSTVMRYENGTWQSLSANTNYATNMSALSLDLDTMGVPYVLLHNGISSFVIKMRPYKITPSISITSNAGNPVCAGTAVTFTATWANGGTSPVYQWKKNGISVGTSLATYIDNALADKDTIMCIITSSATCTTTPTDTSNKIVVNVQATTTDVSITSNPGNTVCAGKPVSFTATIVNGGTAPVYQWQVNGTNTGTNSSTFTLAAPANNDIVRCVTTSNANCITPANNKDTSNQISMQVNPILTPSVIIAGNTGNDICSGTPVTFTATPANGGTAPSYQWKLNGNNVGTNSATYSTNALANGATVTCVMTTNAACASTLTAQSNTIAFTVNPLLVPAVAITTNATGAICDGTSVTYTATVTNGGSTPAYQWKINGINAGTNSSTFTSPTLANNDLVRCVLTSNATCRTVDTMGSNTIAIAVNPILIPTVSITAVPGDSICAGSNVTFSSTNSNGGSAPTYTWMKNSVPVGSASSYSTTALAQGDIITCVMTTNAVCPSTPMVTSNAITMTVKPILPPSVIVSVSPSDTICAGTNTVFTATPTNGGTSPAYQWMINGIFAGTGNSFATLGLLNNDIVTCTMTTNAICPLATQALGNSIKMTVNPLFTSTIAIAVSPNDTVCQGTMLVFTATPSNAGKTPEYQWKKNGLDIPAAAVATYSTATLANNDAITCELTVADACATAGKVTSNTIAPAILPITKPSVSAYGIKAGDDLVLVAIAANAGTAPAYQWIKNGINIPGATDSFYISSQLTNDDSLWVRISSNEPCALPNNTFSNKVFIKQVTRVEAAGRTESKFELYPNPNTGDFTVKGRLSSLPPDQTIVLTIVNGLGQSVYKHTHAVTSVAIDLQLSLKSDLPPGIYYLYLADGHRNIPLRFQLQSR